MMPRPTEYVQSIMQNIGRLQEMTDEELAIVNDELRQIDDDLDSLVMAVEEGDSP